MGWSEGEEPACSESDHEHGSRERHRHRSPVALPSGAEVWAVSYEDDDPYDRDEVPDFGLYLDEKWATPPWDHEHLAWPDFGLPTDLDALRESLSGVLARAKAGVRVELGCWGAHGRTGTALACLAVLDGHVPDGAVEWVRANYCERAVETPEQQGLVSSFTATRGNTRREDCQR